MKIKIKNNSGFTLIELMVAIAIVAVLATIGFSLLQSAQAQARDAKRKGDIDAIATALENKFNATSGTYSPALAVDFAGGVIPAEPLAASGYTQYAGMPAAGAAAYTICSKLEKGGGNYADAGTTTATGATAIYYCRKNQQQ